MVKLVNRARMTTPSIGTGTLTLGVAVDGFQSFAAAGVVNGAQVRYVIEEGSAWEIGTGTYSSSGPTLTRGITESSAGGNLISLNGTAIVSLVLTAADLAGKIDGSDPRLADAREWTASTITQAEAEAGTAVTRRAWNAQRVRQAILGWWFSSADKTKLDGIATGAQVNVGTNLGITGTGNARTITSSTGSNVTIPVATSSTAGLMATGDKSKLDGIETGADRFPPGTKMLFAQSAAPTGWTKDTTHNNKALRVVSGTAGSGGSLAFTTAFGNRTTGSTAAGGTVAGHSLSHAQMPGHNHRTAHEAALSVFGNVGDTRFYGRVLDTFIVNRDLPDNLTGVEGGGQAHAHGFTGASHAHGLDMQVQYVDIIIATKA